MRKRTFVAFTFLFALALHSAEKYMPFFNWHIPLGVIPVPIMFWVIFLAYSAVFIKNSPASRKSNPLHVVGTGIALNLMYFFIGIEGYRKASNYIFEAGIYRFYYYLVYYLGIAVICFMTRRVLRRYATDYIAVPFLGVFLASLVCLGKTNPGVAISAVLITGFLSLGKDWSRPSWTGLARMKEWIHGHEKSVLSLFFIGALAIRVLYLIRTMTDPNYLQTGADGAWFDSLAWQFANNGPSVITYATGYWFFVGFLYKIFGHNYFAACFAQAILGSLTCLFLYHVIKIISKNRPMAYLGFFLAATNFGLIFSSISLGHQALDCFLLPSIALLLIVLMRGTGGTFKRLACLVAMSAASGYAVAARESNIFLIGVVPIFIIAHSLRNRKALRGIAATLIFLAFFFLSLTPFIARNIRNFGTPYPVTFSDFENRPLEEFFAGATDIGNNELLALGINPFSDPKGSFISLLEQPGAVSVAFAESVVRKFRELFLDQTYGRFDMLFLIRGSPFYNITWFYGFLIVAFGICYMLIYRGANMRPAVWVILTFIFFKTLPHFLLNARFGLRAAIDPFLIVAFCIGFMRLIGADRSIEK